MRSFFQAILMVAGWAAVTSPIASAGSVSLRPKVLTIDAQAVAADDLRMCQIDPEQAYIVAWIFQSDFVDKAGCVLRDRAALKAINQASGDQECGAPGCVVSTPNCSTPGHGIENYRGDPIIGFGAAVLLLAGIPAIGYGFIRSRLWFIGIGCCLCLSGFGLLMMFAFGSP